MSSYRFLIKVTKYNFILTECCDYTETTRLVFEISLLKIKNDLHNMYIVLYGIVRHSESNYSAKSVFSCLKLL